MRKSEKSEHMKGKIIMQIFGESGLKKILFFFVVILMENCESSKILVPLSRATFPKLGKIGILSVFTPSGSHAGWLYDAFLNAEDRKKKRDYMLKFSPSKMIADGFKMRMVNIIADPFIIDETDPEIVAIIEKSNERPDYYIRAFEKLDYSSMKIRNNIDKLLIFITRDLIFSHRNPPFGEWIYVVSLITTAILVDLKENNMILWKKEIDTQLARDVGSQRAAYTDDGLKYAIDSQVPFIVDELSKDWLMLANPKK